MDGRQARAVGYVYVQTVMGFRAIVEYPVVSLVDAGGKVLANLKVVHAKPEHRNFILSTWLKSYEKQARNNHWSGLLMKAETFRSGEAKVAEKYWTGTRVVVSDDDQYTIHGWVCFIGDTLLHCYVPPALRESGLSMELVHAFLGTAYQTTKPMPGIVASTDRVTFNPYVLLKDS